MDAQNDRIEVTLIRLRAQQGQSEIAYPQPHSSVAEACWCRGCFPPVLSAAGHQQCDAPDRRQATAVQREIRKKPTIPETVTIKR